MSTKTKKLAPIPPGVILKDFIDELELTVTGLAEAINVPANRISQIVNGKRAITADTAIRLAVYFCNSPQFWMNLQTHYDLQCAEQGADLKAIKPLASARGI